MKVLFVHPPGSYVDMPTLGIPCLAAYLKKHTSAEVQVWDSNIEFLEYLLNPETLRAQEERISSGKAPKGDADDRARMLALLPLLRESLPKEMETFHDPKRYYDLQAFRRAQKAVETAIGAYSTENEPLSYVYNSNGFYIFLDEDQVPFRATPLLEYLSRSDSFQVLRRFFQSNLAMWKEKGPFDLVAISCPNPHQLAPALVTARALREAGLAKKVVLGGAFISSARRGLINHSTLYDWVDYLVTFEGEEAIRQLVLALGGEADLSVVPNLHYREGETLHHNAEVKIGDLNALPTPDFSDLPLHRYWTPEPVLPLYATRGCYYDICTFCNHHENYFGTFRVRSTEKVIADLTSYERDFKASKIFFVDELMMPRQQVEIAEQIVQAGLKTKWYAHARVAKQLTKERLEIMARGGLTLLHVGMESANTRVLELMKKGYDRETVLQFLSDLRGVPMTLHLNTIKGLPGEEPDEYLQTLETAYEYAKTGDFIHLYEFGLYRGAPVDLTGSPYLDQRTLPDDEALNQLLPHRVSGVRSATPEEERRTSELRCSMESSTRVLAGLFPKDCCWAAHLLYVSHYRNTGRSDLLDQPLTELSITAPYAVPFVEGEDLGRWSVAAEGRLIFYEMAAENGTKWFVLNPENYEWIALPSFAVKPLQGLRTRECTVGEFAKSTGENLKSLTRDLYTWSRAGVIQIGRPPSRKKRKETHASS